MAIVRSPRPEAGWYALDRRVADDSRLSWGARGLLIFLLCKPDNWRVSVAHLINSGTAGRDAVRGMLRELVQAGYLKRNQVRDECGAYAGDDFMVFDAPQTPYPATENPSSAERPLDKTVKATKTVKAQMQESTDSQRAEMILAGYSTTLPDCRKVGALPASRLRLLKKADHLARDFCARYGLEYGPAFWATYWRHCSGDDWLAGRRANPNNAQWKQGIDTLLSEKTMARVFDDVATQMEGKR